MIDVPAIEKVFSVDRRDYVKLSKQELLFPSLIPDNFTDLEGSSGWRGGVAAALRFFGRVSKMACWRGSGVSSVRRVS